jgi:hypothetical protein
MRSRCTHVVLAALIVVAAATIGLSAAWTQAVEGPRLPDLDGRLVNPLEVSHGARAVVVVFVSTDCPVSNRYAPELRRLHERFQSQGVEFVLVYPNPADSPEKIRKHLAEFGHPGRALRDPDHVFVKAAGATVTPEAVVYAADGAASYRGRIDDRYVRLGVERPAPTRHDLADALVATLASRPPVPAKTDAVGCFIADLVHVH